MKIFKYLILAVLIISLTKKVHVFNQPFVYDSGSIFYSSKSAVAIKTTDENKQEFYINVLAVNPTLTPPNIAVPAFKFIATIPNLKAQNLHGYGSSNNLNLFGFEIQSDSQPIFDISNHEPMGLYWTSDHIATTLNNQTFVSIIEKKITPKHGFYALGPVWTWFNTKQKAQALKNYGISIKQDNFKNLVHKIGYIVQNEEMHELYGVLFNSEQSIQHPANIHLIHQLEQMPIKHETILPFK